MKISLLLPTNRTSYSAIARVLECASLDPEKFEVIVRDNSEDAAKGDLLASIRSPALRFLAVPNRGPFENFFETFQLATGDFVFYLADDDWLSIRGLEQLHALGVQAAGDPTVACLTGDYVVESSTRTELFRYANLDSHDAAARLTGYLAATGANALYYSALRRPVARFWFELQRRFPLNFHFHDLLGSLLFLSLGRILQLHRIVYFYDSRNWETWEKAISRDRMLYIQAGLPQEIDHLHYLLCAMEGCLLLNSRLLHDALPVKYDRKPLMDLWLTKMFLLFRTCPRDFVYEPTAVAEAARNVARKWTGKPEVNLNELLVDVCTVLDHWNPANAHDYYMFWSSL